MSMILAKIFVGMLTKLLSEKFISKMLILMLRAWSNNTVNAYDDKVVDALSEALGVEVEKIKPVLDMKQERSKEPKKL